MSVPEGGGKLWTRWLLMSRATAFSLCLQKSVNCPIPSKRSTSGEQASHKYRMSFTASAGHRINIDTGQYIHIPCMVLTSHTQQYICSMQHFPSGHAPAQSQPYGESFGPY